MILGTFDRYLSASKVRRKKRIRTPTKRRKQAQTISAKIVELAADRNINAGVGLGTQRLAGWAELDARFAVLAHDVVGLAVAALVLSAQIVGPVVLSTSLNQGQAALVVIGREESGRAGNALLGDVVDVSAVGDNSNAVSFVGTDIELIDTSLAFQ